MALTAGSLALHNGSHGSILTDWVAPPPRNIHPAYDILNVVPTVDELIALDNIYMVTRLQESELYIQYVLYTDAMLEFIKQYVNEARKDPGLYKKDYLKRIKRLPIYLVTEEYDGIYYYKSME